MTEPRITIIGLGLIGGSIGLGLEAAGKAIRTVGHDIDPGRTRLAQKLGAVKETSLNLIKACEGADLVVIATPITAVRETLALIGPHLKPGAVVTDTITLKEPVLGWAAETLPERVAFVGGVPLLGPAVQLAPPGSSETQGLEAARADLFQDALYLLCPAPHASPQAVKRVTNMVSLLQARPFYIDPGEHDGMRAAVEGLPALVSVALMQEVGNSPGWREARKVADQVFAMATAPLAHDTAAQQALVMLNAAYLLPRLDALLEELAQLRQSLAEKDAAALGDALKRAAALRDRWLRDRRKANWEEELGDVDIPGTLGSLKGALGLGSRRPKSKEE